MRIFLLLVIFTASLRSSGQQGIRELWVAPKALFAFDPLTDRYERESLVSVATYVEAFVAEGWDVHLRVSTINFNKGTKLYLDLADKNLLDSVLSYLNASICLDTLSEKFTQNIYDFPQSRSFNDRFMVDIKSIKRFYSTPLRRLDSDLRFDPYAPSNLSGLIHDFQLLVTSADFSIFAPTKLNMKIDKEIYISNLMCDFYYDNDLVVMNLSGGQVHELLENIYSARYYTLRNEQSDCLRSTLPASMHNSMAGASFTVNLTKEKGRRIEDLNLDKHAMYSVAMNSFTAMNFANKFYGEINGRCKYFGDYKTLLIKYLQENRPITNTEKWSLKPERWIEKIKAREILEINNK